MKRLIAAALIGAVLLSPVNVKAEEETTTLQPVRVTGYCKVGKTASGQETTLGGCAYKKELIGRKVNVYDADMNLIGQFVINDTGGKRIREGLTVDIWRSSRRECFELTCNGYLELLPEETEGGEATNDSIKDSTNDTEVSSGDFSVNEERQK